MGKGWGLYICIIIMKVKKLNIYEISVVVIVFWCMVVVCYWRRVDVWFYVNFWLIWGKLMNWNECFIICF